MGVAQFDDNNFETEVLKADVFVLVDFWAPWCGPCRMIVFVVEELARENMAGVKIGKLNIDDAQRTAIKYDVTSISMLMIFKGGEVVDRFVGVQPKSRLQDAINAAKA